MKTSHQLARELLELPDLEIFIPDFEGDDIILEVDTENIVFSSHHEPISPWVFDLPGNKLKDAFHEQSELLCNSLAKDLLEKSFHLGKIL